MACGKKERSSLTEANYLKDCLFSPPMSSPLKNKGPHDHDDVLPFHYLSKLKNWFDVLLIPVN